MASRRRLTKEFKQEAVRFVLEQRVAMSQVARDLGLHEYAQAVGAGAARGSDARVPWRGPAEAGAGRVDASAARSRDVTHGARHPTKAAAYFAKESM